MLECGIDQFGVFRVEHGTDTTNFYKSNSFDSIYWPDTIKERIEAGEFSEGHRGYRHFPRPAQQVPPWPV